MKFYYVDSVYLDDNDVIKAVREKFHPEDVFSEGELESWARENGFVKKEENE